MAKHADSYALAHRLARGNPAPYQGVLRLGAGPRSDWVVTASPELFLSRHGDLLISSPIKGTTGPRDPFLDKDYPENIMITDLVRNDLGRTSRPGTVTITELLQRQEHPGLARLVSTVQARIPPTTGWGDILAATLPPGCHRRTETPRPADHLRIGTHSPRPVLRRGRVRRCRRQARATRRRHPHLLHPP